MKSGIKSSNTISYCLSFILSALSMLVFLNIMDVGFGGSHCIIDGDMREVYIPAIKSVCRSILQGQNIFYSWNYDLGINTLVTIAFDVLSPINLLYLVFYSFDEQYITIIVILIRTGLAAVCFNFFVSKIYKADTTVSILFSIFYSMCSFQVMFNIVNIIWLDALWELPILFFFLHKALENGKYAKLSLVYAYIFISNFYMGYMLGIISFVYYMLFVLIGNNETVKGKCKSVFKYIISVFLAVGMAAIIWLPVIRFMQSNYAGDSTEFFELTNNIFSLINQLYFGQSQGHYSSLPYIYCGIPVALLIPVFFIRNEDKKSMIVHGILFIFTLISCSVLPLYKIWHGFDSPDGWTFRFAYIISFIICIMAVQRINQLSCHSKKLAIYTVIIMSLSALLQFINNVEISIVLFNMLLMAIWAIMFYMWMKPSNKNSLGLKSLILVMAMIECIANATIAHINSPTMSPQMLQSNYQLWRNSQNDITARLDNDDSYYRVNNMCDYTMNPGSYFGYNCMSYFTTIENPKLRNTLSKLGLYSSPRIVQSYGLTPITKMLFDVKYDVHCSYYDIFNNSNIVDYEINENSQVLPLGFMVSENIKAVSLESDDAFANTNSLIDSMTGTASNVYIPVPLEEVLCSSDGFSLYADDEYYYIELNDKSLERGINDSRYYEFAINSAEHSQIYSYIVSDSGVYTSDSFILKCGAENSIFYKGKLCVSYIKELENTNNRYSLQIIPDDNIDYQAFRDIMFYEIDESSLALVYEKLSSQPLNINSYSNGYIDATVNVSDDSTILFTSIPYDEGWDIKIEGTTDYTVIPLIDNTFIGIELPGAGEYHITFDYKVPGLFTGFIISLISLALVVIWILKY